MWHVCKNKKVLKVSPVLLVYVKDIQQLKVKLTLKQSVIKLFSLADQPVMHELPVFRAWKPLS